MLILAALHDGVFKHVRKRPMFTDQRTQPISTDQRTDGSNRDGGAHPPTLLTVVLQLPIIIRPLRCIAEKGIGSDNLCEPQRSTWIAGMQVGMVRLDCVTERFPKRLSVVIGTSTKQIVKRFHWHVLNVLEGIAEKSQKTMHVLNSQIRMTKLISIELSI